MRPEDEAARSVSLESPGSDYPAAMVSLPQPARSSIRATCGYALLKYAQTYCFFEAKRGASSTGMAERAFRFGHLAVYSTCMVCVLDKALPLTCPLLSPSGTLNSNSLYQLSGLSTQWHTVPRCDSQKQRAISRQGIFPVLAMVNFVPALQPLSPWASESAAAR